MKKITLILTYILMAALSGCTVIAKRNLHGQQGNIITQAQVAKLHVGMSESAVRKIMGDPVYDNTFSNREWEYVYYLKRLDGSTLRKHVQLVFVDNQLKAIHVMTPHLG